jgi:malonyl-CoA/methylmalonyl-CoA synthetase
MNHNLFAALRAGFLADPDRVAIGAEAADATRLSYTGRDLERSSAMMAHLLIDLGVTPGARVAVHTDKSVETLILYLAVLRAGLIYVPLNPAYQQAEMDYFLSNARPAVVVCAERNLGWIDRIAGQAGVRHVFTLNDDRTGTLLDSSAHCSTHPVMVKRAEDDVAAILYTSGTTGRSKGAMLTHGNLRSNALVLKDYWDWQPHDVLIHALPIFHVHGLFVAIHGALLNGSTMLWMSKFDPRGVIDRLPRATVFMGVPTLYTRLLQEPGLSHVACASMRLFISGSAPLRPETFNEWRYRTGHTILERYGMSETLMLTSNPCKTNEDEVEPRRVAGTVGAALPGVGLRIVDELDQSTGVLQIGHVQVHGPNVFAGYWDMPEKTAEDFVMDERGQRWFRTGDVGFVDAEGRLTLIGRSKDLIISGGFNVYPAEIEGYLNELPGVMESAVIGVPHPDFGEGVVAVVVPGPQGLPPEAFRLQEALKAQIAGFKVPRQIIVLPQGEELPRNAMGKVQKNLLRERCARLFVAATP